MTFLTEWSEWSSYVCDSTCGGGIALSTRECLSVPDGTIVNATDCIGDASRSQSNCAPEACPCKISQIKTKCPNRTMPIEYFIDKYIALIGGENNPTRVDLVPLNGAPTCPSAATQLSLATSGAGLSGGIVQGVPVVCGEAGVDFVCHKLENGASQWTPVDSGLRFFESAMHVYDNKFKVIVVGGR